MAAGHGRLTVFKVGANDLSAFCKTSEVTIAADVHDRTGYGAVGHQYAGGLLDSKITVGGTYEQIVTATSPRKILEPLVGTSTTVTRQPEGTAVGKPQDLATCVVKSYVETAPVADLIQWTAEFTVDGVVNSAVQ